MATPTGTINASDVNVELGRAFNAPFNLNDSAVRTLAGKPSGTISFADLRGKSNSPVNQIGSVSVEGAGDPMDSIPGQASLEVYNNGKVYGVGSPYGSDWYKIYTSIDTSGLAVVFRVQSGSPIGSPVNTYIDCNTSPKWYITNYNSCTFTLEFYDKRSGSYVHAYTTPTSTLTSS